jgi:hypothetical protein
MDSCFTIVESITFNINIPLSEELIHVAKNFIIISLNYCIFISNHIVAVSIIDEIAGSCHGVSIANDDISTKNHVDKERK